MKRAIALLLVLSIFILTISRCWQKNMGHSNAEITVIKLANIKDTILASSELKNLMIAACVLEKSAIPLNRLHNSSDIKSDQLLKIWLENLEIDDGWGNPMWCEKVPGISKVKIRIWSCGSNGNNEGGGGDDIAIEIWEDINEPTQERFRSR